MKVKSIFQLKDNKISSIKTGDFESTYREWGLINIYPVKHQRFFGFGGAITESTAYNYSLLSKEDKKKTLEMLFSKSGLNYNFCRLCIGSSDFTLDEYCYVDNDDFSLKTFSIKRDKEYIIPCIKDILEYNKNIKFFASPWSPPAFMKENNTRFSGGKLKEEYYELYANYLVKFLDAYKKENINISALTLQNEPNAKQTWESCQFNGEQQANFAKVLRKLLNENGYNDIKLFCWDHNKERLFEKADEIFSLANDVLDGVAFHWYSGEHFGGIKAVREKYPNKLLFSSEFCISEKEDKVETKYSTEILGNISSGAMAICEWNLLLDENGGPYHNRKAGCDAPLRLKNNEIKTSEIYNETYLFSHFIESGAVNLATSTFNDKVKVVANENPNGEIVVNIINTANEMFDTCIYIDKQIYQLNLDKNSQYVMIIEK